MVGADEGGFEGLGGGCGTYDCCECMDSLEMSLPGYRVTILGESHLAQSADGATGNAEFPSSEVAALGPK